MVPSVVTVFSDESGRFCMIGKTLFRFRGMINIHKLFTVNSMELVCV